MEHSDANAYLNEVLTYVRWKKAHSAIRRELSDHIEDARLGFLAQGMDDGEAQKRAVMEMGDAADVGARFDKAYRPAKNYGVWIPFLLIMAAGFFLRGYSAWPPALPVFTFLMPAVFIGFCFLRLEWFVKHAWALYGLYLLAVAVLLFILGAWGYQSIAHYLPLLFPVLFALLIYKASGRGLAGMLLLGAAFAVPMLHLLYERPVSLSLLAFVCVAEFLYAMFSGRFACKKRYALLAVLPPALLFLAYVLLDRDYFLPARPNFLLPWNGFYDNDYLTALTSDILKKVSWFGATDASAFTRLQQRELFGNSNYFMNDYFLVWLSAWFGRIVFVLVGGLFAAFFAFALRASLRQKSMLYRLASLGVTLLLLMQFTGYFLANLGFNAFFAYPLPFVSSGNAAMLVNAALTGLLFSMFYNGALADDEAVKKLPRWRVRIVREEG